MHLNAAQLAAQLFPYLEQHTLLELLLWPPDVFALTSLMLDKRESYRLALPPFDGEMVSAMPAAYTAAVGAGDEWRQRIDSAPDKVTSIIARPSRDSALSSEDCQEAIVAVVPSQVLAWWKQFIDGWTPAAQEGIHALTAEARRPQLIALLALHSAADEACKGLTLRDQSASGFRLICLDALKKTGSIARFSTDRGRVLPKSHTAQSGLTLRSLSLHIGYHSSSLEVAWLRDAMEVQDGVFNILLMPWPFEVGTQDFTGSPRQETPGVGYFHYNPRHASDSEAVKHLVDMLEAASRECPAGIDLVVFPEASLQGDVNPWDPINVQRAANRELLCVPRVVVEELARLKVKSYVIGLRRPGGSAEDFGDNFLEVGIEAQQRAGSAPLYKAAVQAKHHRWKLDRHQIDAYSLGRCLTGAATTWWEGIHLRERALTLVDLGQSVTMVPLICEDLARQDPMAAIVRSIGPSLVVAILMDGPQLRTRWSANYATVLADDPGCSVIALTCKGMTRRWASAHHQRRDIVAIWKDPSGPAREVDLSGGAAVLLAVEIRNDQEFAADGRQLTRKALKLREVLPVYPRSRP